MSSKQQNNNKHGLGGKHKEKFETKSAKQLEIMQEEDNNNNNNEDDQSKDRYHLLNDSRPLSRSSLSTAYESEELESSRCSPASSRQDAKSSSSRSSPTGSNGTADDDLLLPLGQDQDSPQELSKNLAGKQLNIHPNLVPETRRANLLIDQVRRKFLETIDSKQEEDSYESSDLEALRQQLPVEKSQESSLAVRLIARFFHLSQFDQEELSEKDLNEILEKLRDFLQFRRQHQVPRIRADQFCQELFLLHGIFPFGYDRQQLPVLYLRAHVHRRWSHKLDEAFRRYVIWQIDLMTKSYKYAQVKKSIGLNRIEKDGSFGICFDCIHVSYSCVDMDFLRFLVRLLVHYYPTYCRYALCVDLPWLFRSIWKVVRSWLPEDAQNTVQLITSKQLVEYIAEDQIPNSINISEDRQKISEKRKHRVPEDYDSIRNFDEFAKELKLASNEVKSFKSHLDKVLKDYRQLGAI